jgi:hypothetical protein
MAGDLHTDYRAKGKRSIESASLQDLEETGLVFVTVWISIADAVV